MSHPSLSPTHSRSVLCPLPMPSRFRPLPPDGSYAVSHDYAYSADGPLVEEHGPFLTDPPPTASPPHLGPPPMPSLPPLPSTLKINWRVLVFRPEGRFLLCERWAVTPIPGGKWVASWRYGDASISSPPRPYADQALDALVVLFADPSVLASLSAEAREALETDLQSLTPSSLH